MNQRSSFGWILRKLEERIVYGGSSGIDVGYEILFGKSTQRDKRQLRLQC